MLENASLNLSAKERYIFFHTSGILGYSNKSYKELAQELDCSISSVSSTYFQAKKKVASNAELTSYLNSSETFKEVPHIDLSVFGAAYILGSVYGWFGYPKKDIYTLAQEFGCSSSEVLAASLEYLARLSSDSSLSFLGDEIESRIENYLNSIDSTSAYILASINGWLGYPKKNFETLSWEFKCGNYGVLANMHVSEERIKDIYNKEYKKLMEWLLLGEDKARK